MPNTSVSRVSPPTRNDALMMLQNDGQKEGLENSLKDIIRQEIHCGI
jgi:hypothetical protein